jgi:hypothetical protein
LHILIWVVLSITHCGFVDYCGKITQIARYCLRN